jgi:hypothetical protein
METYKWMTAWEGSERDAWGLGDRHELRSSAISKAFKTSPLELSCPKAIVLENHSRSCGLAGKK